MKTTNKTNGLVAVNNSSSKTNKIFNVVMVVILLVFAVSCKKEAAKVEVKKAVDYSLPFKLKDSISTYNNFVDKNDNSRDWELNKDSIVLRDITLTIIDSDIEMKRALFDILGDGELENMFIRVPNYSGVQLSEEITAFPITFTYPSSPDYYGTQYIVYNYDSKYKNMWLIYYQYKGRHFFYLSHEANKNSPTTILELVLVKDNVGVGQVLVKHNTPVDMVELNPELGH